MPPPTDPPLLPPLPPDESPTVEAPATSEPPAPARKTPQRRPRPAEVEVERRLSSAGHGLIVLVLALVLALVLSAPGVHKRAYNEPEGWERDLTTALTAPLADVSHALLLDRPRHVVQMAIGRGDDDKIDVAIAAPVLPVTSPPSTKTTTQSGANPSQPTQAPATTPKRAFTPQHRLRLWIAGDSLVITPGYAILRATGASPVLEGIGVDGKVATGLTRPDVFNWFEEIKSQMKTRRPGAVVLAFGGNDDKRYMTGLPEGVEIGEFGDAAWRHEYRRRLAAIFSTITRAGGHVIWIGLPITRSEEQTQRFDVVNATVAAEARRWPGLVTYIDTYTLFAGPGGKFAEYLPNARGSLDKVRTGDGVHFDKAGGAIIAREVLKALNKAYDLTSWRTKKQTA